MSQHYDGLAGVEWITMDGCNMKAFRDNQFTLVIDKGMVDSLFGGFDYVDRTLQLYSEVKRVLTDKGHFLSISHAAPLTRVPYLRQVRWAIDICKVPEGESLSLFILEKTDDEELINRPIPGAEAALPTHSANVVSHTDQRLNTSSMSKHKGGNGQLTVTASLDYIQKIVQQTAEMDG
jgi:hypothetical protein